MKWLIKLIGDKVGESVMHRGTFSGIYEVYDFLGSKYYFLKE